MSRRLAIGLGAVVLSLVLLVAGGRLLGGNPSGPRSSSYATSPGGLAALASLLSRTGVRVERSPSQPADLRLAAGDTVFALGSARADFRRRDTTALRDFVQGGGTLVVSGAFDSGSWLREVVPDTPAWTPRRLGLSRPLAATPETAGIARVASGTGAFEPGGAARALLGAHGRALLLQERLGSGAVDVLASDDPLTNARLAEVDDAALGIRLAGTSGRVVFLEGIHGYSPASGLAALPGRFKWAFAILAFAAATFVFARFRRLGPPEVTERILPPPRVEFVTSIGRSIRLTRDRWVALEPLQLAARRELAAIGGVADDAPALRATARDLGFEREVSPLFTAVADDESALALGRAAAKIRRAQRRRRKQ